MKRIEIEEYIGKAVLIYATHQQIYQGLFHCLQCINGNEVMNVQCVGEECLLPIQDVLYMIETKGETSF